MEIKRWLQLGFLAVLLAPAPAWAFDSVPQWMKAAAAEKLPVYPAETDAVQLLNDCTLTVHAAGNAVEHCREVIRILRPQGRDWARFGNYYSKEDKLDSLKIWSISPTGREFQLPDKEIEDFGLGGGNLYEDSKWRGGTALAAEPGAVVAMEFEQHQRPYFAEYDWLFQDTIPVHRAIFTLALGPGMDYTTSWLRRVPMEPSTSGTNQWQWSMTDVPAIQIQHVGMHPAVGALAQRMTVHYFDKSAGSTARTDWKSIGEWLTTLSQDRIRPTPEIAAKAQQLAEGKADFYSRTAAITNFMQDEVRYYGMELGIGGWQPHPAADVFRYRYGDCKDKATLFLAMLQTLGIQGRLVLVDTRRGVIDPQGPSMFGNHMIAAVEVPPGTDNSRLFSLVTTANGKRYVIFDPTQPWIPFGQIPDYEQGGYGLLIAGAESELLHLPVESPDRSTVKRSATFRLQADGTLTGEMSEERFADDAMDEREFLVSADNKGRDAWLDRHVRQDLQSFTVDGLKIENLKQRDRPLQTRYQVTVPQFSKSMGNLLFLRARVLGKDGPALDHERVRTLPIELGTTHTDQDEFLIELPSGYSVDELPAPVKLDVGFASYESKTTVEAEKLHYTRTYIVRQVELPAEKYPELEKLVAVMKADEQARAVLKKN